MKKDYLQLLNYSMCILYLPLTWCRINSLKNFTSILPYLILGPCLRSRGPKKRSHLRYTPGYHARPCKDPLLIHSVILIQWEFLEREEITLTPPKSNT